MEPLDKRIEHIEETVNEMRSELRTLRVLMQTDHPSALNKIRFITEKILSQMCKDHAVTWGKAEPTLENMIGPLVAAGCIPKDIAIFVRNIQSNTSPGSHFQESPLSAPHVQIAQMALVEFLEWYYGRRDPSLSTHGRQIIQADANTKKRPAWLIPAAAVAAIVLVAGLAYALWPKPPIQPLIGDSTHTDAAKDPVKDAPKDASNDPPKVPPKDTAKDNPKKPPTDIVPPNATPDQMSQQYGDRIQRLATSSNLRQAIAVNAEYEAAVLKRVSARYVQERPLRVSQPRAELHLRGLSNWKAIPIDISAVPALEAASGAGFELLLSASGPEPEEQLVVIVQDQERFGGGWETRSLRPTRTTSSSKWPRS